MAKEKYRSRVHMLLLYPDNEQHVKALEIITQSYDNAYILHDKDVNEDGEIKKAHWHVIIRTSNPTWSSAICKELSIEEKFIEQVKKFDNALQYLIHYNDTDKAQYSQEEVKGNLKSRLKESINKQEKSEGEKVVELIEYIENYDGYISMTDFAKYCATNGYWSEFRRSGAIFTKIIDEHNRMYIINEKYGE